MTNNMIILWESVALMEQGKIGGSGIKTKVQDKNGNDVEVELPEQIHTFKAWKELGYVVKKGEHAVASFPIWKHTSKKIKNDKGEEEDAENMFMKTAHFFTRAQVEPISKDVAV